MKTSPELLKFLQRNPLPWLSFDEAKGKLIMVVDNHLLSMYRMCPQHYIWNAVFGQSKRAIQHIGATQHVWFLEFGVVLHKMLELYYRDFRKSDFNITEWATKRAVEEWRAMEIDKWYSEHKEYKSMGGVHGFVGLLIQYGVFFTPLNEKIRVIAQEVSFGRKREVPLYIGEDFELYLSGRMDLLIDDGYFICPLDHKSMGYFKSDPGLQFETDDGPCGYVYSLSKILPTVIPEDQILKRDCSKILMNLISKKVTKTPAERFMRIAVRKTAWQLEQYQLRQISTAIKILADLENVAAHFPVFRNSKVCTNWSHTNCTYYDVCRQQSQDAEEATFRNGFIRLPIWNTEEVKPIT